MSVSNPVIVTKQFADDFELVANYYGLKHIGEYLEAKDAARNDLENAIITYAHLASEVRKDQAAA